MPEEKDELVTNKEILFKVVGYRPGCPDIVRRGIKVKIPEETLNLGDYIETFRQALEALYQHECEALDQKLLLTEKLEEIDPK